MIVNELGLHLRSAGSFVRIASRFKSQIRVGTASVQAVDGKSILGLLTLGAVPGTPLLLCVDGPDEAEAIEALMALVENRFGE
jgi:phosphocarrier protein